MDILDTANRDPRMYDLYVDYLTLLKAEGVDMFAHYNYISAWGRSGAWGALEYLKQPIESAPKYRALISFNEFLGSPCDHGCGDVAGDYGRDDCNGDCIGDFDLDGDVDGMDLDEYSRCYE